MWEAIAANRRRSILLIALMGILLTTFGACIGMAAAMQRDSLSAMSPEESRSLTMLWGFFGAAAAAVVWLFLWMLAALGGEQLMLYSAGAREIRKEDSPRLWNIVEEMSLASGLAKMPRVFLVEDPAPNAFAVGRKPETAAVAVTTGLLRLLNRDELQGVVAHEIGHIHNLDIRFMTLAAVMVGSIELLSRTVLQVGPHAGHGRRSGNGRSEKGAGILIAIVFVLAVLSPLLAQLLYMACSRQREYLADASAARFTRYPDGLASALEKIAVHQQGYKVETVNRALAALCIINPLEHLKLSSFVSTHPPTETRIKILRSMGGGAGYVDYEAAWKRIQGRESGLSALEAAARSDQRIRARGASSGDESAAAPIDRAREVADLVDRFANYLIIPCACGMRIKVPPGYQRGAVECPRCSRLNALPAASTLAPGAVMDVVTSADGSAAVEAQVPTAQAAAGGLQYERRSSGWDAFRCPCGQTIQLGPDFPLDYTVCANCNRRIDIRKKPGVETRI